MPSCAGTAMVTICMLTLCIRSANGVITANPGARPRSQIRPNLKTRPRSYCLTILTLTAAPAKPIAPSTASTSNNMTTSNAQHPGPGGKSLLEAGSEVARCLHGSRGCLDQDPPKATYPDARGLKRACCGLSD